MDSHPPPPPGGIEIAPNLHVPPDVLRFSFVRSSGPGGQNVNKLATKAVLRVAIADLPLPPDTKARLQTLATFRWVGQPGSEELLLSSESQRSQDANRETCLAELRRLLIEAARRPKRRRPTRPTKGSQRRRIEGKKLRGEIKRLRREHD